MKSFVLLLILSFSFSAFAYQDLSELEGLGALTSKFQSCRSAKTALVSAEQEQTRLYDLANKSGDAAEVRGLVDKMEFQTAKAQMAVAYIISCYCNHGSNLRPDFKAGLIEADCRK